MLQQILLGNRSVNFFQKFGIPHDGPSGVVSQAEPHTRVLSQPKSTAGL